MIPYFALLLIPAVISVAGVCVRKTRAMTVAIRISDDSESDALPVFFFLLTLMLIFRHEVVGRDLPNYKYMFYEHTAAGMEYIFGTWQEVLFRAFNWLVMQLTGSFRMFLLLTALIAVVPIARVYNQDKKHGFMKVAVFVNMSTFIMLFSGVRQAMAMGVGMIAYRMVREKRVWAFLIWAAIAMLIHHSGIMVFFMYPLYHVRLSKKHLLWIVPAVAGVLAFNRQIFGFLVSILESTYDKYSGEATSTGALGSLILFALFSVFIYVITDEKQCDQETFGLRNFLLFAVILQCFASVHSLAMRMNYYYILFIPLALGKALDHSKKSMRQVAKAGEIVITVFFTVLFLYSTYQSYLTGESTLDTIPYVPFWRNP